MDGTRSQQALHMVHKCLQSDANEMSKQWRSNGSSQTTPALEPASCHHRWFSLKKWYRLRKISVSIRVGEAQMTMRRSILSAALLLCCSATNAFAEAGVSDKEIVIGAANVLSGPSEQYGRDTDVGMRCAFNTINDAGGINGRKIR